MNFKRRVFEFLASSKRIRPLTIGACRPLGRRPPAHIRILPPRTDGSLPLKPLDPDESPEVAAFCDLVADILASALAPDMIDSSDVSPAPALPFADHASRKARGPAPEEPVR